MKGAVEIICLILAVVGLRLLSALPPKPQIVSVQPTKECLIAKETLRQNRQGLIAMARDYHRDTLIVLEENRWITSPLEAEVSTLCI